MVTKMRLLNVCETAKGGVGSYLNYLSGMSSPSLEMQFVVPAQHTVTLDDDLDLHRYDYPKRGATSVRNMITTFLKAKRAFQPDVCFFHSTLSLAALAAMRFRFDKTPAIYCAHSWAAGQYPDHSAKARVAKLIEGNFCGLADRIVNVSKGDLILAQQNGYRGQQVVIENAVPEPISDARSDLFGANPNETHLLFVGRMDPQKGLDLLLTAFADARRTRPDLYLHVVGEAVRHDGSSFDVPEGVTLEGWVDKSRIDDWYRSADALIVPSRWEGLPLVIPEALRNGTPVFCSDKSGMAALVTPGKTGDAFALNQNAIAACLRALNKPDLTQMRTACRASYEVRFSSTRLYQEMASLLEGII